MGGRLYLNAAIVDVRRGVMEPRGGMLTDGERIISVGRAADFPRI